ncbi:hypothetical protein Hanom_Chr01g00029121 [Helianthus anomalus]
MVIARKRVNWLVGSKCLSHQGNIRWSLQPHLYSDAKSLYRASSCPQEHQFVSEPPGLIHDPSFPSNISSPYQHLQLPNLSPTISNVLLENNNNLQLSVLHGSRGYNGSGSHLVPLGLSGYSKPQKKNYMLYMVVKVPPRLRVLPEYSLQGRLPRHKYWSPRPITP